jgi:hypothetical protein
MATSVGPDGIDVTGYGWTNQSSTFNSNKSLESYGAASSSILNAALRQGYSAWSFDPIFSGGTPLTIGTTIATLVYVAQSFTCSHLDFICLATLSGNVSAGIWPATAPAGTAVPLAFSAATAATAAGVNTLTFNGTSSPTSINLTGGQSYFVTLYSSAATTVDVLTANAAYTMNASTLGYSITTTYRVGHVATTAALTTASVFGTSTLDLASIPWIGLH